MRPTSGAKSISYARSSRRRSRVSWTSSAATAADLERALRDRRGAAHAGDDARRGRWFDRAPIEIVASDASAGRHHEARHGRYGPRAFRNLPAALRDRYFAPEETTGWSSELRRRVSYDIVNSWLAGRSGPARRRANRLLPERVHLLLRSEHPPDAGGVRAMDDRPAGTCASGRRNRCCA